MGCYGNSKMSHFQLLWQRLLTGKLHHQNHESNTYVLPQKIDFIE